MSGAGGGTGTGGTGTGTGGGTGTGTPTTGVLPPAGAAKLTQGTGGQCLTAGGASNGVPVALGACAPGLDWTFSAVSGGYTIGTGGRCLDGGASGSAAALWTCDGTTEQVWILAGQGDGSSLQNRRFSKCLEASGDLAACATVATQSWKALTAAGGGTGTGGTGGGTGTGTPTTGVLPPAGAAKLTSGTSSQCLTAGGPASGAPVSSGACAAGSDWTFSAVSGGYTIGTGGRCLDGGASGSAAALWACDGTTEQVWILAGQGDGSSLQNRRYSKCLEASGDLAACTTVATQSWKAYAGTGTDGGTGTGTAAWTPCAVQDATCTFSGTRTVRYGANGIYATRTATGSILCSHLVFGDPLYGVVKTCDVQSAAGTGTGTGTGGDGPSAGKDPAPVTPPGETAPSGNVFLINRQSGMCVSVPGGQANAGGPSRQTICRGAASETWSFVNVGTGYQIKNLANGFCLYADRGLTTNGPSTVQQPCNPTNDGGRWQIRKVGQWFEIVGIQSGRCITVTGGSRIDGGPLNQQDCDKSDPQRFTIAPATFATASWTAPRRIGIVPVSAAPLPSGKLLMWAGDGKNSFDLGTTMWTTLYDPATDTAAETNVTNAGQMFCPGTNILADGRILTNGGRNPGGTSLYDPATNTWSKSGNMRIPRGYNGNTTLSTGEALTYGGSWSGDPNSDKFAEVWSPTSGQWRLLGNVSGETAASRAANPVFRDNHYWLFAARDGFAFNAGPDPKMFWIDTRGNGALQPVGNRGDDIWSQTGTATMYDVGRILKIGGNPNDQNQFANDNAYTIDITGGPGTTPRVSKLEHDPFPRTFHNSVVLPDGDVVTVGGHNTGQGFADDKAVMIPTIWSPDTGKFRLLPPISVPRTYHSWVVLMPDGRVASGGGGLCGNCSGNHPDFQFLNPPYLYDGAGNLAVRPVITSAPTSAEVGSRLSVSTDRAAESFSLVRMSATTHTVNADQRRVPLSIATRNGNAYELALPAERGDLLPGPWMLFAMDANGVPSVSKIVRIR